MPRSDALVTSESSSVNASLRRTGAAPGLADPLTTSDRFVELDPVAFVAVTVKS